MILNWKKMYQERLKTAEEAIKLIKSGDRVTLGLALGEPSHIVDVLVENREQFRDVEITHMFPLREVKYTAPGMEKHFRYVTQFVGATTREHMKLGFADYTPCFFHQVPEQLSTTMKPDVALIHVSPPDEHGYVSLGAAVDYTKRAAEVAPVVIAQVNKYMPRTMGETFIHVSQITCFVEHDEPLAEVKKAKANNVAMKIGEYIADLIHDGDCLQLGVGAIPEAVIHCLKDKKDLGIHTEMFSDGVMDLVEAGVINNTKKNINRGMIVSALLMGTKRLYDYVDNNPLVAIYPVDYTNDPCIASQIDNLVSINSCIQVDLLGQVCSEMVGENQISGVGGQVDFARASAMSKGGRAIIAMPSTTADGKISKIVASLDEGAAVTTSRNDVHYIITEYGVADLKFHTVRERAASLINIAHPGFRKELIAEYEMRFHAKFPR